MWSTAPAAETWTRPRCERGKAVASQCTCPCAALRCCRGRTLPSMQAAEAYQHASCLPAAARPCTRTCAVHAALAGQVVTADEDGCITGLNGTKLRLNPGWTNPTGGCACGREAGTGDAAAWVEGQGRRQAARQRSGGVGGAYPVATLGNCRMHTERASLEASAPPAPAIAPPAPWVQGSGGWGPRRRMSCSLQASRSGCRCGRPWRHPAAAARVPAPRLA